MIRLPDFVTKKDFDWAVETASKKKKMDCSKAEFLTVDEGLCVQIMHHGSFDDVLNTPLFMAEQADRLIGLALEQRNRNLITRNAILDVMCI